MTKEEKKAIEYWKAKLKDYKKEIIQRQNDEFKGYGTSEDIAKLKYCNLHTVLNLIQKQQEEIEKLNQDNKKLDKQAQEYFENLMFKDKVIHEMAKEMFFENNRNVEMQNFNKYQEIIEYFEKKVEFEKSIIPE